MYELTEQVVNCPYCGEPITVLVDPEESGHNYIEDCQVCCAPIVFAISSDGAGNLFVEVRREDE